MALGVLALALVGCGGSSAPQNATITGRVVDENGIPVRGATVSAPGDSTVTSSGGAFALNGVREGDLVVKAFISQNGTTYRGQNVARTLANGQAVSLTILLAPEDLLGRLEGTVRDRQGRVLQGASVFALGAGALNSSRAITDANGRYQLGGLVGGYVYDINVGGGGYASSTDQIEIVERETVFADFTLGDAGFPVLPAPANLSAITWTTPAAGRDPKLAEAFEAVKRLYDPRRATRPAPIASRLSSDGNLLEVELEWDEIRNRDLLGYEVFRASGSEALRSYDFYREPLAAVYVDGDQDLRPFETYRYAVSAVGTRWPDDPNSAGPLSDEVDARTLDDLRLDGVDSNPTTFLWRGGSGAERYVVYLFNEFPGYDVESIWDTESSPTSNLFQRYTGPINLVNGRTYYYLVLGLSNGTSSRTLSPVGSFVYRD